MKHPSEDLSEAFSTANIADDLLALRHAAETRNGDHAQYWLKRLLIHMDYYYSLAVLVERVYDFVETWEGYYPKEVWPRKIILAVVNVGIKPESALIEMAMQQSFHAPGAGNFLKALYDMTQAMDEKHQPEARLGFIISAIMNANMAILVEAYYGTRLGEWEQVRTNQFDPDTGTYSNPEANQISYQFWTDTDTALIDSDLWLQVADSVEEKFKRMGLLP
ncbi:hypothetical protein MASR2M15_10720 [Anaerolineales bacterium]